jgi:hypothetical protein
MKKLPQPEPAAAVVSPAPAWLGTRGTAAISHGATHRDPYAVLVSEIMLQQTQVDRVLPKYHEWLGRYPTFEALARPTNATCAHLVPARLQHPPRRLQAIRPRSGRALRRRLARR